MFCGAGVKFVGFNLKAEVTKYFSRKGAKERFFKKEGKRKTKAEGQIIDHRS